MKIAVYTGLFTDNPDTLYGDIIHYQHDKGDVDYIAYTNSDYLKSDFWDIRKIPTWRNGRWTARMCKTKPHELLPEYDVHIWMDNQIYFTVDPIDLVDLLLVQPNADLAVHQHCDRTCLYQEINAALQRNPQRDKPETLLNQAAKYKQEGVPEQFGLGENGILFRMNNSIIREFNEAWFQETANTNTEDQVSMVYTWWNMKDRLNVNHIPETFVEHNYRNTYLPKSQHFATLPREVRNVKT